MAPDSYKNKSILKESFNRIGPLFARSNYHYNLVAQLSKNLEVLDYFKEIKITPGFPFLLLASIRYLTAKSELDFRSEIDQIHYTDISTYIKNNISELLHFLKHHTVQTNYPSRSFILLLGLNLINRIYNIDRIDIAEIGSSLGLNLNFDKYSFIVNSTIEKNRTTSGSSFEVAINLNHLINSIPTVEKRVGIDIHPIDISNEHDYKWLCSCIWWLDATTDSNMNQSLRILTENPVQVIRGDVLWDLKDIFSKQNLNKNVCVFQSCLELSLTKYERSLLKKRLKELSKDYSIFLIKNEIRYNSFSLSLSLYKNGELVQYFPFGNADSLGEKIKLNMHAINILSFK